jgi:hypothetical protein
MSKTDYSRACTEALALISYLSKEDYLKIPTHEIEFLQKNMDNNYVFTIDPTIDLPQQNVSKEAFSIIISLFDKYFASDKQKQLVKEILQLNEKR